jgi:hypothetical protein
LVYKIQKNNYKNNVLKIFLKILKWIIKNQMNTLINRCQIHIIDEFNILHKKMHFEKNHQAKTIRYNLFYNNSIKAKFNPPKSNENNL